MDSSLPISVKPLLKRVSMAMNNNQLSDLTKKLKQSAILYQGKKVIDMKPFINFISNDLGLKKQDAMELGKAFNLEAELN